MIKPKLKGDSVSPELCRLYIKLFIGVIILKIVVNGKEENLEDGITVSELIKIRGLKGKTAVWVNNKQLLLKEHNSFILNQNDKVKVLRIIGGG